MWAIPFVVGFWFTVTQPLELISDSTKVFFVEYSRKMDQTTVLNPANYTIIDENGFYLPVYSVHLVTEIHDFANGFVINIPQTDNYTDVYALVVPHPEYKISYTLTVQNIKDKNNVLIQSGNPSTGRYYNHGFYPNLEARPEFIIKN